MRDIETTSDKTSEITGVTDGPGLPEEPAGTPCHGRGRARRRAGHGLLGSGPIVRTLAHRSAEEANEIKDYVDSSSEHVGRGVRLVDQAWQRMSEIVIAIGGVNAVVSNIISAAAEQPVGAAQVGNAVTQIEGLNE